MSRGITTESVAGGVIFRGDPAECISVAKCMIFIVAADITLRLGVSDLEYNVAGATEAEAVLAAAVCDEAACGVIVCDVYERGAELGCE